MSDSGSSGSEDEGPSEIDIRFTCKKCPGKEFRGEEREAHREYHRQLKLEKQVGRNARARRRAGSPALSATTNGSLFSVQQSSRPGPKSRKRTSMRTADQRRAAAIRDHKSKSKKPQEKNNGG